MEEIFKDIPGYEGKYQASNTGKIISLNFNNTNKPKELKQNLNSYGYYEVSLSKNNKKKTFLVSTLVAKTFLNNNKMDQKVIHLCKNKKNNNLKNLAYGYESEIKFKMYKHQVREGNSSGNKISYKNKKYKNFKDMAEKNNVKDYRLLSLRLHRGWNLEDALEVSKEETENQVMPRKFYNFYGEILSIKQIAKKINIPENIIRNRLNNGWSIYECETPIGERRKVWKEKM